ncbi:methyltransferase domain-containing protein [Flavivirga aquimarina]|uniref:Methyltransferase domain-containing protein n=1 Tax=Flavivirga aquimarina TaxID=2027862 RepID=A0ABT8WEH9_9FLAO|nr:methyltransferase domain-containing protein [Flavivirga aquimarina]MDO5971411.1 methyltransferase domain-containing protein [Flavivirga aquimarina]
MIKNKEAQGYWSNRYKEESTGWDIGYPSTPLKEYIDQLTNKNSAILIPGAGNAYEAAYLYEQGFKNIFIMDISLIPLENFQKKYPDFPKENILHQDFFEHEGQYDLVLEQTFFCSFPPTRENRISYASKIKSLLKPKGKLVGLWFDIPLTGDMEKRPFGGTKALYLEIFSSYFKTIFFEKAYNSIPDRAGNELFGILSNAEF